MSVFCGLTPELSRAAARHWRWSNHSRPAPRPRSGLGLSELLGLAYRKNYGHCKTKYESGSKRWNAKFRIGLCNTPAEISTSKGEKTKSKAIYESPCALSSLDQGKRFLALLLKRRICDVVSFFSIHLVLPEQDLTPELSRTDLRPWAGETV